MKYLKESFQILKGKKKKGGGAKGLPNLTDKSSKNNQAFYFIFQKYYLNFILQHPTLFYMLHYLGGLIRDNGIAGGVV